MLIDHGFCGIWFDSKFNWKLWEKSDCLVYTWFRVWNDLTGIQSSWLRYGFGSWNTKIFRKGGFDLIYSSTQKGIEPKGWFRSISSLFHRSILATNLQLHCICFTWFLDVYLCECYIPKLNSLVKNNAWCLTNEITSFIVVLSEPSFINLFSVNTQLGYIGSRFNALTDNIHPFKGTLANVCGLRLENIT